jgi:hypothetical protein
VTYKEAFFKKLDRYIMGKRWWILNILLSKI